jgi:LmbE family N-acetylglucosaminyl deacetylase
MPMRERPEPSASVPGDSRAPVLYSIESPAPMSRIVAIAPHAGDAVLSCGGTLARNVAQGHEVFLITVLAAPDDLRRADDECAAAALRLSGIVRLEVPGAIARGYPEGLGCFDGLAAADEAPGAVAGALAVALARLTPDLVLAPMGLTGHVDQVVLDTALDDLGIPRLRWVDLPHALTRTPGAPLGAGELVVVPIGEQLAAKLEACACYPELGAPDEIARHATAEGARLGADEPVELLVALAT